jgi:hypothetical protein
MGTPKKPNERRELYFQSVAERTDTLSFGKKLSGQMDAQNLPIILEKIRVLALPLVEWLDKPLLSFYDEHIEYLKYLRKKRAFSLFEIRYMGVFLQRSGKWIIRRTYSISPEIRYREVNSDQLAGIVLAQKKALLEMSPIIGEDFFEKMPRAALSETIRDMAVYVAVLEIIKKCSENIFKAIKEKEQRLGTMKGRVGLLNDLASMLDPLLARDNTVEVPGHYLYRETDHGTSWEAGRYLCKSALDDFWKEIERRHGDRKGHFEENYAKQCHSLADFLGNLKDIIREIDVVGRDSIKDAKSLLGYTGGRLPLNEEEISVLLKLIGEINKISKE